MFMTNNKAIVLEQKYKYYYDKYVSEDKQRIYNCYYNNKSKFYLSTRLSNLLQEINNQFHNFLSNIDNADKDNIINFCDSIRKAPYEYISQPLKNHFVNHFDNLLSHLSLSTQDKLANLKNSQESLIENLVSTFAKYNSAYRLKASTERIISFQKYIFNIDIESAKKKTIMDDLKNDFSLVTPNEKDRLKKIVVQKLNDIYLLRDTIIGEFRERNDNKVGFAIFLHIFNEEFIDKQLNILKTLICEYQDVYSEIESLSTESLNKIRIGDKVTKRDVLRIFYAMKTSGVIKISSGRDVTQILKGVTTNDWDQLKHTINLGTAKTDGENIVPFISELVNFYDENFKIKLISELNSKKSNK